MNCFNTKNLEKSILKAIGKGPTANAQKMSRRIKQKSGNKSGTKDDYTL